MWIPAVAALVGVAYAVYRIGLSLRAARAEQAGHTQRSQFLRERAFHLRLAFLGVMLLLLVVFVIAAIATR